MRTLRFDIEIPDWCNWVAQDADGEWYAYRGKPKRNNDLDSWDTVISGDCDFILRGTPPKDFTQELYKVT